MRDKKNIDIRHLPNKIQKKLAFASLLKWAVYVFLIITFVSLVLLIIFGVFEFNSNVKDNKTFFDYFCSFLTATMSFVLCVIPAMVANTNSVRFDLEQKDLISSRTSDLIAKTVSIVESPHYTFVKSVLKNLNKEAGVLDICDAFFQYNTNTVFYQTIFCRTTNDKYLSFLYKQISEKIYYLPTSDTLYRIGDIVANMSQNDNDSQQMSSVDPNAGEPTYLSDVSPTELTEDKPTDSGDTKPVYSEEGKTINNSVSEVAEKRVAELIDLFYSYAIDVANQFESICHFFILNNVNDESFYYEIYPVIREFYTLFYPLLRMANKHGSFDKIDFVCRLFFEYNNYEEINSND